MEEWEGRGKSRGKDSDSGMMIALLGVGGLAIWLLMRGKEKETVYVDRVVETPVNTEPLPVLNLPEVSSPIVDSSDRLGSNVSGLGIVEVGTWLATRQSVKYPGQLYLTGAQWAGIMNERYPGSFPVGFDGEKLAQYQYMDLLRMAGVFR